MLSVVKRCGYRKEPHPVGPGEGGRAKYSLGEPKIAGNLREAICIVCILYIRFFPPIAEWPSYKPSDFFSRFTLSSDVPLDVLPDADFAVFANFASSKPIKQEG